MFYVGWIIDGICKKLPKVSKRLLVNLNMNISFFRDEGRECCRGSTWGFHLSLNSHFTVGKCGHDTLSGSNQDLAAGIFFSFFSFSLLGSLL